VSGARGIDLREGGRWTSAQRVKNDLLWLLASGAVATLGRLPPRVLRAVGTALGVLAHAILPGTRRLAERNVALALPELDAGARRELVARTYRTLGGYLGDAVAMLDPRRPASLLPFADGARDALDVAIARRRGVVFASAHLGPWERVAATLHASELPFTAVAREAYDPRFNHLYDRLRGLPVIYRGAPGAATRLLRTLRRCGVLGIPMDLASRVASVEVPFLGHIARTPVGPARLALRTRAEVVVGVPAPGRDDAAALELAITTIQTDDLDTSAESERILSTRINEALSMRIRALPAAWVWMHPRWGSHETRPALR
jgi:KDO2-lipid IV(A) lauroyltransferase